ncbi:MAG: tetratricopeptide repeat protein [Acidobacteria bacterium]|nr:tetratricopeptide repeat protein [Acidobacteriota bacterium]
MSQDRLQSLQALLEQDPNNAFVRYGLAQALASAGKLTESVGAYRDLIARDPGYVAAYYHGGQTLEKLGDTDAARKIYEEGMEACKRKGDMHTHSEIQAALDMLG